MMKRVFIKTTATLFVSSLPVAFALVFFQWVGLSIDIGNLPLKILGIWLVMITWTGYVAIKTPIK